MHIKTRLLVAIAVMIPFFAWAQAPEKYTIQKGEIVTKVIPFDEQHRFPEFYEGQVVFFNDAILPAKFNYNILYGEVHFLNGKGDTLAVGNDNKIKHIKIGEALFYFSPGQGFLEETAKYQKVSLLEKQRLKVTRNLSYKPDRGGYWESKSSVPMVNPAGDARGELHKDQGTYKEIYNRKTTGIIEIEKEVSYFFMDQNKRIYPVRKSSIRKIFFRNRRKIKSYLAENKIDFTKEKDLKKLLDFCSRLSLN